jgi:hypothetical protein
MFIYGFPLAALLVSCWLRDLSSKVSDIFPGILLQDPGSETCRSKVSDIFPGFFLQEPGSYPIT